ncbi:permease component of ABC-type sugar transporter [Sphaerochaeta pleomorpha str. Grapes]|uniref:Permease component of ABC-type sugar transporter n=1 Tax=Sphaerochaeta pleomorpha (strain ATCC BAA-1885 / DSM 22778 / Grapes) TaxID=158190 RepID=G8QZ27_SPHPG|nr:sugar ABC transporter permease [Sphaerochaeta pleomorpha]AEV30886.1 permease component of ABC-type sugar transporter [Sphaerochaeta pleomorpha str. Grapes]
MKVSKKIQISSPRKRSLSHVYEPYLFLLPSLTIFSLFLYYPFIRTMYLSAFLTNKVGKPKILAAFTENDNYLALFKDPSFWASVVVTFQFVAIVALGGLLIGLTSSLLTEKKYFGSSITAAVYAMPIAIASAAASMSFKMILHPTIGLLNSLMGTQINFTGDSRYALASVAGMTIWLTSGINFIFISAGLRNVPAELYDSASVDGAGYWRKVFNVTLPCISPTLFFQIIINIIGAFQAFSQIKLLTEGGPGDATNVMVWSIYKDAFRNFRFGAAASRSIVLFLIVLTITIIQFRFEKRGVNY